MAVAEILHYTYDDYNQWEGERERIEGISVAMVKKNETVKFTICQNEGAYYVLVYPDDLKAKAYRLQEGRYIKVGDLTHEMLRSENIGCDAAMDYGRIFEKFRSRRA